MGNKKELKNPHAKKIPKEIIKDLLRQLHEGKNSEEIKRKFQNILRNVSPTEIAQVEQELVNEGLPQEELRKLCDVHLAIFRDSLNKQKVEVPTDHPLHVFMEEHKTILKHLEELKNTIQKVETAKNFEKTGEELHKLKHIAEHLMEVEKHNIREENVLFPYLQKHGITEPPAIMWAEHNELKEKKKKLIKLLEAHDKLTFQDFAKQLAETGNSITEDLAGHIYKENHILYPAALQTINAEEWKEIREQCDELGYCCFTPGYVETAEGEGEKAKLTLEKGFIDFETGSLTPEEIEAILNTLPLDITFVDAEDTVRYFNKAEERAFPRTKAVIGRKVQQCHPPKSIHIVNKVLNDLRSGKRKSADFWIDKNQKKIHIRYFPVRNLKGEYLGCLEVTQDITNIQKIKGERRLLNEIKPK
ncbi:MAG: DUF438 domain-containing protein [Candidatus Bathyarchaeia archaeon]